MAANLFVYRYGSFEMSVENGIYITQLTPHLAVKAASATVEGRPDGYLGSSYPGFYTITAVGKVIGAGNGTDYEDYEAKFDAFLAALAQTAPTHLYRKADEYYLAQVTAMPANALDGEKTVAWCDFTVLFRGRRVA